MINWIQIVLYEMVPSSDARIEISWAGKGIKSLEQPSTIDLYLFSIVRTFQD